MRRLHYHRVDVFTDRAFGGNPLAVFTNGRGLSAETMQAIAKEFNLSETTFVLPPEDARADFRVRIFTPASELPMAGHPTIGTSYVLAREHLIEPAEAETLVTLEEGVGLIPVRLSFERRRPVFAEMSQPLPAFGPRVEDPARIAAALSLESADVSDTNLPVEVVSCGVPFLYVPVRGLEAIRRARLRLDAWEREAGGLAATGLFLFTRETEVAGSFVHSRMFAPDAGIVEDPATGSASGPLGCYLVRYGVARGDGEIEFTSEQGIEMGRPSFVRVRVARGGEGREIGGVYVGGQCHYMGEGFLEIDD